MGTVRDPFYTGSVVGVTDYTTVPITSLDQLPAGRIDSNAVKLLDLYPKQTGSGFINNWVAPRTYNLALNQYDLRIDSDLNQKNIIWGVWDVYDALENQEGILPGVAEGANYGAGNDWSPHWAIAGSYTHIFSPTMTNVFRMGYQDASDYNVPPTAIRRASRRSTEFRELPAAQRLAAYRTSQCNPVRTGPHSA